MRSSVFMAVIWGHNTPNHRAGQQIDDLLLGPPFFWPFFECFCFAVIQKIDSIPS